MAKLKMFNRFKKGFGKAAKGLKKAVTPAAAIAAPVSPMAAAVADDVAKAAGPAPQITVGMDRNKALRTKMGLDENMGSGKQATDGVAQPIGRPAVDGPGGLAGGAESSDPAEIERKRKLALTSKTMLG